MKDTLIHLWRLLVEPSGKDRIFCFQPKRWQVVYPCGNKSIPMAYDVACDYRDLFGGTVIRYQG